ncbi:MAG TPA: DUF4037 domain-containing protein [Natronosporangium sp.]
MVDPAGDSPGQALARRFYQRAVAPSLAGLPHAAALLGDGSEVLGYDDTVSTDHNFGPRVQLFLEPGAEPAAVRAALAGLPERFEGWSGLQVEVTTAGEFFASVLGVDPAAGMRLADWLLTPTQRFASLTAGPVFHDPAGSLTARRAAIAWYPDDIWRYVLAAGWLRVGQEQPFVGRAGGVGDEFGAAILAGRLARDLVRLTFLVERRWPPYSKWLGRAFADLPLAERVGPPLRAALAATGWREREAALCAAATEVAAATNRLGLAEPVDPAPRQFYTRDIRVVDAEGFTTALIAAITDPEVRALLARLGVRRPDEPIATLPGSIDQAVDSTDVLANVDRCRAAAPMLGLGPG